MGALPGIVAVVSFIVYAVGYKGNITASTLFASMVAFSQLRFPLLFYPMTLAQLAQASVSAKRVEEFLRFSEVECEDPVDGRKIYDGNDDTLKTGEITVNNGTFYWGDPNTPIKQSSNHDDLSVASSSSGTSSSKSFKKNEKPDVAKSDSESQPEELRYHQPILSDVTLKCNKGELLAIIGRVGSGKNESNFITWMVSFLRHPIISFLYSQRRRYREINSMFRDS